MNDEIREILEHLKNEYWRNFPEDGIPYKVLYMEEVDSLLDYITNLQNENDDLKNRLENAVADCYLRLQENEDYKSRVEKAVEYIKTKGLKEEEWQNGFCEKATATYTREEIFDLLNILQGENNE